MSVRDQRRFIHRPFAIIEPARESAGDQCLLIVDA
jgi:hypothetical protein